MSWINKLHETLDEISKVENNKQLINDEVINYLNEHIKNKNMVKTPVLYAKLGFSGYSDVFYENFIKNNKIQFNSNIQEGLYGDNGVSGRQYYNEILQFGKSIYEINWQFVHLVCLIDHYTNNDKNDNKKKDKKLESWLVNEFNNMYANKDFPVYYQHKKHVRHIEDLITDGGFFGYYYCNFVRIPTKYLTNFKIRYYSKPKNVDNKWVSIVNEEGLSYEGIYLNYNVQYSTKKIMRTNNTKVQNFVDDINRIIEQHINNATEQLDKCDYWYNPITKTYYHISNELKDQLIEKIGLMCAARDSRSALGVKWVAPYAQYVAEEHDGYEEIVLTMERLIL